MKKNLSLLIVFLLPFTLSAQIITTVVGGGTGGLGDGGAATLARFGWAYGLAVDKFGYIYVADANNQRVRKVNVTTGIITTIAGTGSAGFSGDGGAAIAAQFYLPNVIAFDTAGNYYIGDAGNNRIRKVDITTGIVTTFAGTGTLGFSGDGGPSTAAQISDVIFTIDPFNNLYIADGQNYRIRKINPSGIISTVAGTGYPGSTGDGGPATAATFNESLGICTNASGNLWVQDNWTAAIRKIDFSTGIVTRVAGTDDSVEYPYAGEGGAATAAHIGSIGIAADDTGNLFIADPVNNRVYRVGTSGIIHSIAGIGTAGFSGDGGLADTAKIDGPKNVALDKCNNVYLIDDVNHRVRKITYPVNPTISITAPTVATIGSTVNATAILAGARLNYSINWYNKGVLFAITSTPTVTYTKTLCKDSITAMIYCCSDSSVSNVHVVGCNVGVASPVPAVGGMTCYPNPVGEVLTISLTEKIFSVAITNVLGKEVYSATPLIPSGSVSVQLDVAPGVYFVRVNGIYTERVVKE